MPTEHSPLPWRHVHDWGGAAIRDARGYLLCDLGDSASDDTNPEANASLIVRAVNSHADLVSALETVIGRWDGWLSDIEPEEIEAFRSILARAKE